MSKKLEQKQQRRALEEARQAQLKAEARRRNLITFAAIGIVVAFVLFMIQRESNQRTGPVGVAGEEAGCTAIERAAETSAQHVEEGTPVSYVTNPPVAGDHYAQPAEVRFYPPESVGNPPPERAVHNLEHGQIVLWYRPDAPGRVVEDTENYIASLTGQQVLAVLAVPYPDLEGGNVAMAAWGAYRTCEQVSSAVIDEFRATFQGKGPENVGVPPFESG